MVQSSKSPSWGTVAVGSRHGVGTAESAHLQLQARSRENEPEMTKASESSKPVAYFLQQDPSF